MNCKMCLFGLIFYFILLLFQGAFSTETGPPEMSHHQPEMGFHQRLPNKTLKMIETTIRIVEIIDDQDRENGKISENGISDSEASENRSVRYATIERKTEKLKNIHSIVQLSCFEKYFSVTPRQGRIVMPLKTTVRIVDIINDAGRGDLPVGSRKKVDLCSEDQTDLTVRIVEIQRSESEREQTTPTSATTISEFMNFEVRPTETPKLTAKDENLLERTPEINESESEFNDAMEARLTTPTTNRLHVNDLDSAASELTSQVTLPTTTPSPTPTRLLIDGNLNADQAPIDLRTTGSAVSLLGEATTTSSMPMARQTGRKMNDDKQPERAIIITENSQIEVTTSTMSDILGSNSINSPITNEQMATEVNQLDLKHSDTTESTRLSIESLPPIEFALKASESHQTTTIAASAAGDVTTTSATINASSDIDLMSDQVHSSTLPSINGNVDTTTTLPTTEMPMSELKSEERKTDTPSSRLSDESMNPELLTMMPPVDTVLSTTQVSISGSESADLITTTVSPLINLQLLTDGSLESNAQIDELKRQSIETTTSKATESSAKGASIEMTTEMSQPMSTTETELPLISTVNEMTTMSSEISIETTTEPTSPASVEAVTPKNRPKVNSIESTEMLQSEMTTESTNLLSEMTTISSQPEYSTETTPSTASSDAPVSGELTTEFPASNMLNLSAELSTTPIFKPESTTTVVSIENPTTTSSMKAIEILETEMTTESPQKSSIEITTVASSVAPESVELTTEFPSKMGTLSTDNPTTTNSIGQIEMTQPEVTTESLNLAQESTTKPTQLVSLTEETTVSSTEPPPATTQTPIETTTLRSEVNLSGKSRSIEATFINYNTPNQPIKESLLLRFKSKSHRGDLEDQKLFELLYTIFLLNRFEKHAQSTGVPGKRLAKIRIKVVEIATEEGSSAQTEVITTRPTEAAHKLEESVPETTTVNSTSTFYTERLTIGSPESANQKMINSESANNSIEVKLRITGIVNENRTENGRITQRSTRIEPIDLTLAIEGQGTADLMAALSKPLEARIRIGKALEKLEKLPKIESNELPFSEEESGDGKRIEPRMADGNETTKYSSSPEIETTTQIESELASLESQLQATKVSMIQEIPSTTETYQLTSTESTETSAKLPESQLRTTESPTTQVLPETTTEFIYLMPESTTEPTDTRESLPTTKTPKPKISLASFLQPSSNRTGKAFNYNLKSKSEMGENTEKYTGPTDLHWNILKIMAIFILILLVISLLFCCIHSQSSKESANETQPKRLHLETDESLFESRSRNIV